MSQAPRGRGRARGRARAAEEAPPGSAPSESQVCGHTSG